MTGGRDGVAPVAPVAAAAPAALVTPPSFPLIALGDASAAACDGDVCALP